MKKSINTPGSADTSAVGDQTPWMPWQKFSFRFFFLFLGVTSIFFWLNNIYVDLFSGNFEKLYVLFKPLAGMLYWLDKHIYHFGYKPETQRSIPLDNHYGAVFYFTVFLFSIIAAFAWSILDKKRTSYNRLFYWFGVYLRYTLAITILGYGIDKLIPVQMPYPNSFLLNMPFGDLNRNDLLWGFIGASPGYSMFTGACETIAALLLVSRRTAVFGCVFMMIVLTEVVALNWFYNVTVKFYSSLLLLYALYLLAPHIKKLFRLFFLGMPVAITSEGMVFKTKWKHYLLMAILILFPVIFMVHEVIANNKYYAENARYLKEEKMYKVTGFNIKDSLLTPVPDTTRWKRVLLYVYDNNMVIYNMKDRYYWYTLKVDSLKKTFTLQRPGKHIDTLYYTEPSKNMMQLTGKWKGKDIVVSLKLSPVDSIRLNKEKIKLIHPEQD